MMSIELFYSNTVLYSRILENCFIFMSADLKYWGLSDCNNADVWYYVLKSRLSQLCKDCLARDHISWLQHWWLYIRHVNQNIGTKPEALFETIICHAQFLSAIFAHECNGQGKATWETCWRLQTGTWFSLPSRPCKHCLCAYCPLRY